MPRTALNINSEELRRFSPLNQLNNSDARELLGTSITTRLSAGTPLFQADDRDKRVFYLLEGEIKLVDDRNQSRLINSATPAARQPLGRHLGGQQMAVANTDSVLLSFDADMLDLFLSWISPDKITANKINSGKDQWLDQLLQSRGLLRFSEDHIDKLLSRMSEVHFNAGDVVIHQDDEDEYYYVIKNGRASVSRKPCPSSKPIKLAELRGGDAFGEEALLSSAPRSATITMEEDGELMRLPKKDFSQLLAEPLLSSMNWDDTQSLIKLGSILLDVRLPDEYENDRIPGSINIPLPLLRLKIKFLSVHHKYIIYCDDGNRSCVAAFLLNRLGFNTYILDGGINGNRQHLTPISEPEKDAELYLSGEEITTIEEANDMKNTHQHPPAATNTNSVSFADRWGHTVNDAQPQGTNTLVSAESPSKSRPSTSNLFAPVVKDIDPNLAQTLLAQGNHISKRKNNYSRIAVFALTLIVFGATAFAALQQATPYSTFDKNMGAMTASSPITDQSKVNTTTPPNTDTTPWTNMNNNTLADVATPAPFSQDSATPANTLAIRENAAVTTQPQIAPTTALDPATRGFVKH